VTKLFTDYLGVEAPITNANRIDRKGSKPCLLKISVDTLDNKISVLQNKMKLRKDDNPQGYLYHCRSYTHGTTEEQITEGTTQRNEQRR